MVRYTNRRRAQLSRVHEVGERIRREQAANPVTQPMTVEKVKETLPMVRGRWRGEMWLCKVFGRLNAYASVSPWVRCGDNTGAVETVDGSSVRVEFSWEAVARAINAGNYLRIGC